MDEPKREKQIGVKLTAIEFAEIEQTAAYAGMQTAVWARQVLTEAARGLRASTSVEVPRASLEALEASVERCLKIGLCTLQELLDNTHHGDPNSEHEDATVRQRAMRRGARKMQKLMSEGGLADAE